MNKYLPYILIGIALIAGLILNNYLGLADLNEQAKNSSPENNRIDNRFDTLLIYPKKNKLVEFELVDQNKVPFTNQSLVGRWNLFFIGYTNCPDVCPNTLNHLVQLYDGFSQEIREKYQIIFLAVDPKRDTPEHLKQYLDFFNEAFVGVTGEKVQLDPLVRSLGGIYSINSEEGEYYTVDHSARIFIVDPQAQRFGIIDGQALVKEKEQLIRDLNQLVSDY